MREEPPAKARVVSVAQGQSAVWGNNDALERRSDHGRAGAEEHEHDSRVRVAEPSLSPMVEGARDVRDDLTGLDSQSRAFCDIERVEPSN